MYPLALYLKESLPEGMRYPDAAQLCLRLYGTVDGVPSYLLPLSKEVIADSFAELTKMGWVLDTGSCLGTPFYRQVRFHQMIDRGHWIEVIASIFKVSEEVINFDRGEELAKKVGFDNKTKWHVDGMV